MKQNGPGAPAELDQAADALGVSRDNPASRIEVQHETRQLVLRPTLRTDAEAITAAALASAAELRPFMPWAHGDVSLKTQLARLKLAEAAYWSGRELLLVLCDAASGEHLSYVGLHPRTALNPAALEVGYWTPTAHVGKGLCTLATRLAVAYAFEWLGSDRVQVMHDELNEASRRVVDKCGFHFEGVLRNGTGAVDAAIVAGGYHASRRTRLYALLPEDRAALGWYAPLLEQMTVFDQVGQPAPRP
ncbi:MAG: GNAT family protein [Polyangiaceae bacterium]